MIEKARPHEVKGLMLGPQPARISLLRIGVEIRRIR